MNSALIAYVRLLSVRDRKTLSQKALKTTEEVGEMAKKVNAYESAAGCTHRVVERRDILEECVDTMLCSMSMAYELGFSDEEVDDMLLAKAEKWDSLQVREAGVKYPLPFEMHVTVAAAPADQFRQACEQLGVKPIFLALQDRSGSTVLEDVMTSSVFVGENRTALDELDRIAVGLRAAGFDVVRRKIETVPWHPAAPSGLNGVSTMPPGGYFESHLNVLVDTEVVNEAAAREQLRVIAREHGAHLSRNIFKKLENGAFTVMTTLRAYEGTREAFEARREALGAAFAAAGFKLEKLVTEFSLFDSRTGHDASWLSAS